MKTSCSTRTAAYSISWLYTHYKAAEMWFTCSSRDTVVWYVTYLMKLKSIVVDPPAHKVGLSTSCRMYLRCCTAKMNSLLNTCSASQAQADHNTTVSIAAEALPASSISNCCTLEIQHRSSSSRSSSSSSSGNMAILPQSFSCTAWQSCLQPPPSV
jgi:hypothetical protein